MHKKMAAIRKTITEIDLLQWLRRIKEFRVRCRGKAQLHACSTEEAIAVDEESWSIPVSGSLSNGTEYATAVLVPHAFTHLMMKLHAFDDRKDDPRKDLGRHHAMDLSRVVAMMTEPEYHRTLEPGKMYRPDERVGRARQIAASHFGSLNSLGTLRLREHRLYHDDLQVAEFLSVLQEVFACL